MLLSRKEVVECRQDGRVALTRVTQEQLVQLMGLDDLKKALEIKQFLYLNEPLLTINCNMASQLENEVG